MKRKYKLTKAEKASKYKAELLEWAETAADEDILGHAGLTVLGAFAAIIIVAGGFFAVGCWLSNLVVNAVYDHKLKHKQETLEEVKEHYDLTPKEV